MKLHGCLTALITPFKDGFLDEPALRRFIKTQLRSGISGLVPCGSTGEAATLTSDEYRRVISIAVEEARRKVPVIAGVGTNSTEKAVELARIAAGLGADALLALTPYYNKPTQGGLFLHFKALASAVRIPLVVYNIPGRTAVNLLPATLAQLASACPNIVAVKEASGSLDQVTETLARCPAGFTVLSGDDSLALPMMAVGAKGVISVVSNIAPEPAAQMAASALKGDFAAARRIHMRLFPLIKALFVETNPIPVKAAAALLGLCANELRLPLTPIAPENRKLLLGALSDFGLKRAAR